jgi:integrase
MRGCMVPLARVLKTRGLLSENEPKFPFGPRSSNSEPERWPIHPEWEQWCQRWFETSSLSKATRLSTRSGLRTVGRWLYQAHPDIFNPGQWTREIAAEYVAAACKMRIGDFINRQTINLKKYWGKPLTPRTQFTRLHQVKAFLEDCQEWGWIERRLNPASALRIPYHIRMAIGPSPRVIEQTIWAKLMNAGLSLRPGDIPLSRGYYMYPFEMVKAIAVVWLFAGIRRNELVRLSVGCIRAVPEFQGVDDAYCLLDVPTNKTSSPYTKPVDGVVGKTITEWEAVRPDQPRMADAKSGKLVDYLFCYRGLRLSGVFLNNCLIPLLCDKAGVPQEDVKGRITSHRARSTIASQLYNAREPMSLFQLKEWLGHRSLNSTEHYAKITPTTLTQAYDKADYFKRNTRLIDVLIDREAGTGSGSGAKPWIYYDLGHGYCTNDFFATCPHRMACAKCDFYVIKSSSKVQTL